MVASSVFRGGELFHGLTLEDPLKKSDTDSKGRVLLETIMFLGQKINKTWTNSKLQVFSFIFRSNAVSIKCRFDQLMQIITQRFCSLTLSIISNSMANIKCDSLSKQFYLTLELTSKAST